MQSLSLKALAFAVSALTAAFWLPGHAAATTLTFTGHDDDTWWNGNPYIEQGYKFSSQGDTLTYFGSMWTKGLDERIGFSPVAGGTFTLESIDFRSWATTNFEMGFTFEGGGPTLYTTLSAGTAFSFTTVIFNFKNLLSISFKQPGFGIADSFFIDNIKVSAAAVPVAATPIPAALPLLASALGGLGLLGWRRRARKSA